MSRTKRSRPAFQSNRRDPYIDPAARDQGCSSKCFCHAWKRVARRKSRHESRTTLRAIPEPKEF